ncbi:MAG: hypothetical protein HC908_11600 [Calothrix sp. SM1_7_51]|nr:hypothetical protein [Calothrix sp. SM1_7_51]
MKKHSNKTSNQENSLIDLNKKKSENIADPGQEPQSPSGSEPLIFLSLYKQLKKPTMKVFYDQWG